MPNNHVPNNKRYLQGTYKPINSDKYLGDLERCYFRSSWEKKLYYYLDTNKRVLKWMAEGVSIPYEIYENGSWGTHRYFPDAYCEFMMSNGDTRKVILEIKPASEYNINESTGELKPPKEPKTKTETSMRNYEYALKTFQKNLIKWQAAKKYCERRGVEFYVITQNYFNDKNNPRVKLF